MDGCAVQTRICACAECPLSLSAILAETGPLTEPRTCYILARLSTSSSGPLVPLPTAVYVHAQLVMCAGNPHSDAHACAVRGTESSPHPHLVIFLKEV